MSENKNKKWPLRKVFTILFLLSVIFVMTAMVVPLFVTGRCGASQMNAGMASLKQLQGAKGTWAMEHHKNTNDTPTVRDLVGTNLYIRDEPVCPSGGSYALGRVGERPWCSLPDHTWR